MQFIKLKLHQFTTNGFFLGCIIIEKTCERQLCPICTHTSYIFDVILFERQQQLLLHKYSDNWSSFRPFVEIESEQFVNKFILCTLMASAYMVKCNINTLAMQQMNSAMLSPIKQHSFCKKFFSREMRQFHHVWLMGYYIYVKTHRAQKR